MADRFKNTGIEKFTEQAESPAAPRGLRQSAGRNASRFETANTQLQQWVPEESYVDQAQSWFTGANNETMRNGWDTKFVADFTSGWDRALSKGTARSYFENGGTGVVLWDHMSTDAEETYRFGDVVRDGKKVGNVYDQFDKQTADLMMLPWLSPGHQQARLFEDPDQVGQRVGEFVEAKHAENNENLEKALGAMAFQGEVSQTQEGLQEGASDELLAGGGGAAGGALTGAAAGAAITAFTGPGAAVGAAVGGIIGGVAGGVGGLLNKDEIAQAAARSYEIAELSFEENNFAGGLATSVKETAGFSMKLTSPLQNLARGITDAVEGEVGDGVSERYAVDEAGRSTAPLWSKVADWSALVGDSLLQFASPLNRAVFTAQMSGVISGQLGEISTTGSVFDPRQGGFDNIFIDEDGGFDPVSASAGILNVGINVAQVAGFRGLARQAVAGRAAVEAGRQSTEVAGLRFIMNEAGQITGKKRTLALLAPSEQIAYWSAARSARVKASLEGRAVTADDFFRAANDLANGSNRLKTAMVNAIGEGYEEGAQAFLEPLSVDGELDMAEIGTAALYGAAAGLGMSVGATMPAPTPDERMKAQAYVVETIRRGEEPDPAQWDREWEQMSLSEKRVRATRSEADAELTRSALDQIVRNQAATMVASEADAAKAIDARRTAVERELNSATGRTDAFHVMTGLLDAGRVSESGAILGDTAPAEAIEASAITVLRLLENRLEGMAIQEEFLGARLTDLEPGSAQAEEITAQLATASLARQIGENLVLDVGQFVDRIYDEATPADQAEVLTRELNRLLHGVFERRVSLAVPEGVEASEEQLRDAAAQFVSLIQSREPKLDSGSYLALLPRASWTLTRDRSDNFVQVNTDILQAINGDFDGDKLRAENQLVLSNERFIQARAGQFFAGRGREIDIASRNFDAQLVSAVGWGLTAEPGQLHDEAEAAMANVVTAITERFGHLMSPDALASVIDEFRTAVAAGSADARSTLLNALAREAGGGITDLGRSTLSNEWLWASKVVRANFQAFQTVYRSLRNIDAAGPSEVIAPEDFDTPEGVNRRKDRAVTDAETLALFATGNTLFRKFQKIHYTVFNSSVMSAAETEQSDLFAMARAYEELGRGVTRPEIERTGADDSVAGRVLAMLARVVDSAMDDPEIGQFSPAAAMTVFANVKVKNVWFAEGEPVTDGQEMSLAQLLLARALDADREEHAATFSLDEKLQAKHARLRAMTVPNSVSGEVNAEKAFIEIFKAVPFGDSLGGVTGALAENTTPEQWLRNYISLDANGRREMERLFTNVPEYLDRKERSNIPYSWYEAGRREVSPYRSMMDAMMAVGRASLTFDPTKPPAEAFGGDLARTDRTAQEAFVAGHADVRTALADFRKMANRRTGDRASTAALVQEMFQSNPTTARTVLDLIPNSAANALYELRDGQLYVAPWVYEMFAIEDSNEALFFYWKNLTLAQWNSTQVEGRVYDRLQSRMQRLLFELAAEPGQPLLDLVIRKMDEANDLNEFFVWLNSTPGIRGQRAVLLPFVDDVADFEADAAGGWVTIKAGSDLREAIGKMRRSARQLRDTMAFREQKAATDRLILDGIKRARTGDPAATDLDRANLRKLERAISISRELPRGFAPTAMLALTQGATRSFDAQSHDKGRTATSYGPLGEMQALMDAFAFVPGLERVMETLTAHSIGSLRTNVGDLAKQAGVAMDANGRQIEWETLSVDQAIEMLDDSRTAPLAHALLTPTALDITPSGLSERLLMEASLKDLLDDDHYKDLFRESDDGQLDRAMRYLSLVDAKARAEGGSFDVIRAANDRAIAWTSGLNRPATEADLERLRNQAYLEIARELKMVGQIQATPDTRDSGMLEQLRETALTELRQQRVARALPDFTDEAGVVLDSAVESILTALETEKTELLSALSELYEGEELDRHVENLEAQYARNEERIRGMLEDSPLTATMSRFQVTGDADVDRAAHAQIVEYVRSMTSFPARAPEAADAWQKLAGQLHAGTRPDLTAAEWSTLARAAMGVYLVDHTLPVAGHISLPPFPQGDPAVSDARFYKYFDPDYSYLVTDLLAEDSPMTRAAVWLHTIAEQPRTTLPIDKAVSTLRRTVLNRERLGTWTPGMMSHLVEAHTRMDSAAAGQAIAAAGNGPKRWAAIAAATRRTGMVPPAELLTTVTFTGDLLAESSSRFNEIPVQPAGAAEATTMPVGQLDNRFFAAIRINGQDIPLTSDNLGFEWAGAEEANPYRYVALERLLPVVRRFAAAEGVPLEQLQVEVEFFHPDSAPVGVWNNAFFDGMSHTLLPDGAESLVATLWSDNGGMISTDTQRPLDAGKKGLRAIQPFQRLDPSTLAAAEALWGQGRDFAGMLRRKTELVLGYDDGTGTLDPSYYNAVYKHMQLQHIVVGRDENGAMAAMKAEEVIAFQAANGRAAELPLADAKLVKLSPDVLRTMLGETGDQGVPRFFEDEYLLNQDLVDAYEAISPQTLTRFGDGWLAESGTPADTSLANIGQQRVLTVRTIQTEAERDARKERVTYLNTRAGEVTAARYAKLKGADAREGYTAVLRLAQGSVSTERATFDFGSVNGGAIAPRNVLEIDHTEGLLERLNGIKDPNEYARGWVVRDEGAPKYPGGVLTVESLNADRADEHHVIKDDLALVELDSFTRPERDITQVEDRVEKALRYLANSGANIVLGSGNGGGDLRFHASQYLQELGYAPVAGSKHLYAPVEFVFQTQNERAYASTLRETQRIRPARNAVTFLTKEPFGPTSAATDENVAVLNPASRKLRDRKVINNIVPSSAFPNYNLPRDDGRDEGLYARTLTQLRTVTDPSNTVARQALEGMAGEDPQRVMPVAQALDRFHAKITRRASLVPEVGETLEVGDIIPFVHPDGRVLLYRHGFKLPKPEDLTRLLAVDGMNVALAKSETEPAATANSGAVSAVANRAGYGRTLQLEMPLQPYGDKIQLEWNGMKYVVAPPPEGFVLPPVFGNGTVVDLVSDAASADSKEAFEGRVVGYRNALTFFQYDFTDDLVRFFFPAESPADPQARVLTIQLLHRLANQDEFRIPYLDAHAIAKANVAVADLLGEFAALEAERSQVPADWVNRLQSSTDPSALIARAMVTYLLTPGAHLENVLKSAGFSHPRADDDAVEARRVPGLFADLLDNGLDSDLHAELIRRFDAQLHRGPNGEGYRLRPDWTVEMFDGTGASTQGYLQFGEAHSSGDNPVLDAQAFDITEPAPVSPHNTMAAGLSIGATTAHKALSKAQAFARSFRRGGDVSKLGDDGDSMWQMLTALPNEKDRSLTGFRREMPAETLRRAAAREEIVGFYQPLNTENWSEDQVAEYQRAAVQVLGRLNLFGSQRAMVDTWVRMHLGRPHGIDEGGNELGVIGFNDVMETLAGIRTNINSGLLPVAGGNLPLLDVNHLTTIYLANLNRADGWAPRTSLEEGAPRAASWDAWVETSFGTAWTVPAGGVGIGPEPYFDQMFLLAIDGLMHGYQGATTSTRYLPVSTDILRQRLLMDEKTNRMLVSISADENLLATDPTLYHSSAAELEEIIGGHRLYAPGRNGADPNSAKGKAEFRRDRWRKEVDAPRQVNRKIRGVRAEGQAFIGYTTSTSAFFRILMNTRVGNTLFNLSLAIAAPFEAFRNRTLNLFADALAGEATGAVGRAQARLTEMIQDSKMGAVADLLGLQTTFTSDQLQRIDSLVDALSTLPEFKAMIYRELMYQYPTMPGIGPIEKWLERYARFGARMQDPAWGMLPKDLVRIYLSAAMKKNARTPTGENVYSIERMLTQMPRDPMWLKKQDLEAHNLAIASVSQVRSVKPNVLSLGFRGVIEPMSENPKFVVNAAGNLLKVMTAFQNFWANYGTTITGMQGPVDFMAFWLDGRQKKITARAQAAIRGEKYNPAEEEYFDMSEALESVDLADSFIRGGVTHTGLFALGMMASGLGLSGEDDEMKWRRRQAELQGVPVLYDPRDVAADFRNRDSIFLNWLPFGMDSWFRVDPSNPNSDSLAQMNWITRTFLSPVIGFERFYNTGDFTEVIHGFKDAIGSHPIINTQLWNSATDTAGYLHEQAVDAAEKGDEVEAGHLLMTAVGVLEGMLFENSMVNMVYVGMDEWDRDPYVLPLRDSDGDLQRDITGNVRGNDLALQPFIDPETGGVRQGYLGRSEQGADARVLTENRATLALISSLFSGGIGDSDYWRYNMPIKTRSLDKPEVTEQEAEAYIKAAAAYQLSLVGAPNVTTDEVLPQVRNALYQLGDQTGQFFTNDVVWKAAQTEAARLGSAAMSVLDDAGREHLTTDGARAIFDGLRNGTMTLDSPAMRGVYITYEMREQIGAELSKELVQEGIDLGLDEVKARSRMKRLMSGPLDNPDVPGLADILWDKRISYTDTQTYGQLNTTYVMGPDGRPWATGFTRDGLMGALGLKPVKAMIAPDPSVTTHDSRGNVVDLVNRMNTGLRGIVPFDDSRNVPTDVEIGKAIEKAIEDAANQTYTPFEPFDKSDGSGGSGWRNFGRRGWGSGGGGGGAYFTKMYGFGNRNVPYASSIAFINSSNPYIRRAFVRRERVWSERGRLKQWQ